MATLHGLTDRDVATIKELIRWRRGGGGGKSQRPPPLRRRPERIGGGSGSQLTLVKLTSTVSRGQLTSEGVSYGRGDATLVEEGSTIRVLNPYLTEIEVETGRVAWVDEENRIVVVDCTEVSS